MDKMKLEPGTVERGLTEYVFCCFTCDWRESISATGKNEAKKIARQSGWFLRGGKWRCVSHQSAQQSTQPDWGTTEGESVTNDHHNEIEFAAAKLNYAQNFYKDVCARAEQNIEKTFKLEGAHYAAMQQVLAEYRQNYEALISAQQDAQPDSLPNDINVAGSKDEMTYKWSEYKDRMAG